MIYFNISILFLIFRFNTTHNSIINSAIYDLNYDLTMYLPLFISTFVIGISISIFFSFDMAKSHYCSLCSLLVNICPSNIWLHSFGYKIILFVHSYTLAFSNLLILIFIFIFVGTSLPKLFSIIIFGVT
jgi:hypothetical protein